MDAWDMLQGYVGVFFMIFIVSLVKSNISIIQSSRPLKGNASDHLPTNTPKITNMALRVVTLAKQLEVDIAE